MGPVATSSSEQFSLDDRYHREEGVVYLTGIQALVRMLLDRARHDQRAGRATAAYVSGYEGSPLGGYDLELARQAALLREHAHRGPAGPERGARGDRGVRHPARRPGRRRCATTASPASGTARRPAWTGPPTRCGTRT